MAGSSALTIMLRGLLTKHFTQQRIQAANNIKQRHGLQNILQKSAKDRIHITILSDVWSEIKLQYLRRLFSRSQRAKTCCP